MDLLIIKHSIWAWQLEDQLNIIPLVIQNARLGLKLFAGGTTLNFSDDRELQFK